MREYSYERTPGSLRFVQDQNKELKKVFESAIKNDVVNLFYLESEGLIGFDHEGTVDGIHLSDLGFSRIAAILNNKIEKILNPEQTN